MTLPSVLGLMEDEQLASALAVIGMLSETGFEIQHIIFMLRIRFTFKNGKKIMHPITLILWAFHHSAGCGAIIPGAYYYPTLVSFHTLGAICLLPAGILRPIGEYQKTLDIKKKYNRAIITCLNIFNFIL